MNVVTTIAIGLIAGSLAILAAHVTRQDDPRPLPAVTRTVLVPEPSTPPFVPTPTTEPTLTDPALDQIIPSINVTDQPLDEFINDLAHITGTNIVFNWVALAKIDTITIHATNLSGQVILKKALAMASTATTPLSYEIKNGVVRIITPASEPRTLVLRRYNVRDLLNDNEKVLHWRNHASPPTQPSPPILADQLLPHEAPPSIMTLTKAMHSAAGRDVTQPIPENPPSANTAAISYWNGQLFIRDTLENQQIFTDFLAQRRRSKNK